MSNLNKDAGAAIARFRKRIKMPQAELATLLDMTRTSVSNIERGKQAMSLAMFCRIAEFLHVDPAELLTEVIKSENTIARDKLEEKGVDEWTIDFMRDKLRESNLFFIEGGDNEQTTN